MTNEEDSYLGGGADAPSIFDDLEKLRADSVLPPQPDKPDKPARTRRSRDVRTFARIPHDLSLAIYRRNPRLSTTAWVVLIELDRLVLKRRGRNPVIFDSDRLGMVGIKNEKRARALRELVDIGMILVEPRGLGLPPWVTHLLYPLKR